MGYFTFFIIISFLVLIHELGHFLFAYLFNFDVDKICIYPYGGISKFNLKMNVELSKEFIVLIMGPIFQFIGFFILINIPFFSNYINIIKTIHYTIIFFNMLPIYPLDGGKLLNIFFNYFLNFNKSFKLVIKISYIIVLLIAIYYYKTSFTLTTIFMIIFLIYKIYSESKNRNNYYNKFLLERYLNNYKFKKYKKINSINDFYRDKNHIININNNTYTEKDILKNKFKDKY